MVCFKYSILNSSHVLINTTRAPHHKYKKAEQDQKKSKIKFKKGERSYKQRVRYQAQSHELWGREKVREVTNVPSLGALFFLQPKFEPSGQVTQVNVPKSQRTYAHFPSTKPTLEWRTRFLGVSETSNCGYIVETMTVIKQLPILVISYLVVMSPVSFARNWVVDWWEGETDHPRLNRLGIKSFDFWARKGMLELVLFNHLVDTAFTCVYEKVNWWYWPRTGSLKRRL